jgi:hypothetical protein
MTRIGRSLTIVLALAFVLLPVKGETPYHITGHDWRRTFSPAQRIAWVVGFSESVPDSPSATGTKPVSSYPRSLQPDQIVESLNEFCSQGTNLNVPVFLALRWVDLKAHDATPLALHRLMIQIRKQAYGPDPQYGLSVQIRG